MPYVARYDVVSDSVQVALSRRRVRETTAQPEPLIALFAHAFARGNAPHPLERARLKQRTLFRIGCLSPRMSDRRRVDDEQTIRIGILKSANRGVSDQAHFLCFLASLRGVSPTNLRQPESKLREKRRLTA